MLICFGGNDGTATVNPVGGTPGYTYLWSDGQTTQTANNLTAGNYTCTVTDANGCSFITSSVNIIEPNIALTATTPTSTNVNCFGGNDGTAIVTPNGGTPGYTYLWSDGQTTAQATGLSPGSYNCQITDANGCIFIVPSVSITQPNNSLSSTTNSTNVNCFGGSDGTANC